MILKSLGRQYFFIIKIKSMFKKSSILAIAKLKENMEHIDKYCGTAPFYYIFYK